MTYIGDNRAGLLMDQASMTAATYFRKAVETIDDQFGEGYAKAHPELVGAFMRTCTADFSACFTSDFLDKIATALGDISGSLSSVAGAVSEVGDAIDPVLPDNVVLKAKPGNGEETTK